MTLAQNIAVYLLDLALGVEATLADGTQLKPRGGRTGEGGPIADTPWVEIGDMAWRFEPLPAGGGLDDEQLTYAVTLYTPLTGNERDKEVLREWLWSFRQAIRADYTLGGRVYYTHVDGASFGLITREDAQLWAGVLEVTAYHEG